MKTQPEPTETSPDPGESPVGKSWGSQIWEGKAHSIWQRLLLAVLCVAVACGLRLLLFHNQGDTLPYLLFYPCVIVAALYGGLAAGLLATALSAALVFFWLHQGIASPLETLGLELYLAFCLTISLFGESVRRAQNRAQLAQAQAEMVSQKLQQEIAGHRQAELNAQKLAAIVEFSDDAIVSTHLDGIITSWNRGAEKVFGYAAAEMLGAPLLRLIPAGRRDEENQMLDKLKRGESVEHYETERLAKDGRLLSVSITASPIKDATGQIIGVSKVTRDISEQKRNEAIKEAQLHLIEFSARHSLDELLEETLNETEKLSGSLIGFYHFVEQDQKNLKLQNWSTRTKAKFCKAEGKGMHYPISQAGVWVDCVHQRKPVIHNDYASLPHRKGLPEGHAPVIRELAVPVIRNQKVMAILGVGNKPTDYIQADIEAASLLADLGWEIAERKRSEEEIHSLNAKLEERIQKRTAQLTLANQELEAFSYSVSHDLRSPLRAIDGFSQILLEDYRDKLDAEGLDSLQRVRAASQRMGRLIDDLLQLSRYARSELRQASVDLSALVCAVADDLQRLAPERRVDFVIADNVVAMADPTLIRVVLENLLGNAWKFTAKQPAAKIEFGTLRVGDESAFFVRDNGAGFDMDYAPKLFNAFERLHSIAEFPGTGIGLANVQRLIRRHSGRVWAEGKVSEGATFYFTLPGSDRKS